MNINPEIKTHSTLFVVEDGSTSQPGFPGNQQGYPVCIHERHLTVFKQYRFLLLARRDEGIPETTGRNQAAQHQKQTRFWWTRGASAGTWQFSGV